jgi:hypothetical protein
MTYFRTGSPYYHRRAAVSRSCSGWEGVGPAGYGRQALKVPHRAWGAAAEGKDARDAMSRVPMWVGVSCFVWRLIHAYGVKPYGLLVSVSSRHYCPSTPDLSTWWSATTLQGAQGPGKSHLQARFPLRCFQRLSLPYIATRRCDWRHNRYTSGTSTPVLSY